MSYLESIPLAAGADLSASQYKAVVVAGTIAADGDTAIGIQQNKPAASGRDLTVGYAGRSRYYAGAAVVAGARLTVTTSGWFTTVVSGGAIVGRALAAVSSGGIGEGIFNFATNAENS
ncbi:hypothetical protein KAR91_47770 [Candidatus Pacearchaeota archaeon]|nr:hypothetical protein [Candidatus Pacearchaeota archaeon]